MNPTVVSFEGQMPTQNLAGRTEIDTSAPFKSVKEAANRFGGMGFWKPTSHNPSSELAPEHDDNRVFDILQASQLERDLITKERETLYLLKELETTKDNIVQLKSNVNSDSNGKDSFSFCPSLDPSFILLELKKAKLNLTRTTTDLANIQAAVDLHSKKIEHERIPKRLTSNTAKIEDQTRARIKMAEVRLIAAKKMKEAARASERVAMAEIRSMSKGSNGPHQESNVTITVEEYSSLLSKAKESERVEEAMVGVEEANVLRAEIMKSVEEALEEVKLSKRALEEALGRVEVANREKLAVEEALQGWKLEHRRRRCSHVHNPTKLKNTHSSSAKRRESILVDVGDEVEPVLKATLSIGEILSRKLMLAEEYEKRDGKRKVSLGQMLGKPSGCDVFKKSGKENKEVVVGKKFGIGQISVFVAKQSKKKKNQDSN